MMKPQGFWKVTGHEPYEYNGITVTSATFAVKESAMRFVAENGGEVKHVQADFLLIDGKVIENKVK
jgi:hypothetical protein